jgi:hypothetical protein
MKLSPSLLRVVMKLSDPDLLQTAEPFLYYITDRDSSWRLTVQELYLSAPTKAPTRYAEVVNRVEVGDEEEAEIIKYILLMRRSDQTSPNHQTVRQPASVPILAYINISC